MFTHYLKTAIRHLIRHKTYSVINILGLATGIAFCLLTFLFVKYEWSFDQFHEQPDQLYRLINFQVDRTGKEYAMTLMPETMGPLLKAEFPQFSQIVRIRDGKINDFQIDQQQYKARFLFVDPTFLQMFTFPLQQGDVTTALNEPNTIVLSESTAQKYFGAEDPMGQSITIQSHYWKNEPRAFTVTGIVSDPPANSSIQFDILFPYKTIPSLKERSGMPDSPMNDPSVLAFMLPSDYVFVRLFDPTQTSEINQNLEDFINRYKFSSSRQVLLQIQPLSEAHFDARPEYQLEPPSNPVYTYILTGITFAVLLIACVNFMNLAIARFSTRAREVGVRKMVGAQRGQLMRQFWGESFIVTLLALFLGFALTEFFLPTFNQITQMPLILDYALSTSSFLFAIGLLLFIGLVSGIYPAFILSSFEPIAILKSRLQLNSSGLLRNTLVVLQFTVSILLVIGTIAMFQQVDFLKAKHLGFEGDQIVAISTDGIKLTGENQNATRANIISEFYAQLQNHSGILGVTRSNVFSDMTNKYALGQLPVELPNGVEIQIPYIDIDTDFLPTMGIELDQGKNFDPTTAPYTVLVNETLVNQLEIATPLTAQLPLRRNISRNRRMAIIRNPNILGVVKDFHIRSLHQAVPPLILFLNPINRDFLVRIHPERTAETLSFLADQWKTITGNATFNYVFLDDQFDHQYQNEERWQTIIAYASAFGLFVACLGVLGLTAIAVARRTKEFGIRKVLGATTQHIITLLSREFMILILIANIIAWPIAYYGVNLWMQDFAYRIDINISLFLIGGALVFFTALFTIGVQALQAARKNPVDALRYE